MKQLFLIFTCMLFAVGCTPRLTPSGPHTAGQETAAQKEVVEDSDLIRFEYGYPDDVAKIAPLEGWIKQDIGVSRTDFTNKAIRHQAEAKAEGYPFRQHGFIKQWRKTADTPVLYSLVSETYSYEGGANGYAFWEGIVWSHPENKWVATRAMFRDPSGFLEMITPAYCARLDDLRLEKRGVPVDPDSDDSFNACPDIGRFVIAPVEDTHSDQVTALNIYLPENAAGAHAEGTYTVTIPITGDMLQALKPAYRMGFSVR